MGNNKIGAKPTKKHYYSASYNDIQEAECLEGDGIIRNYIIVIATDKEKNGKIEGYEFPAKSKEAALKSALFWVNFKTHEKINKFKRQIKVMIKPDEFEKESLKRSYRMAIRYRHIQIEILSESMYKLEDNLFKIVEVQDMPLPLCFSKIPFVKDTTRRIYPLYTVTKTSKKNKSS